MGLLDLSVLILQQHRETTLQHARAAIRQGSCVVSQPLATATCFNTNDSDRSFPAESVERPDGCVSPPDARDERVHQTARLFEHLGLGFLSDDRLKLTHQVRKR